MDGDAAKPASSSVPKSDEVARPQVGGASAAETSQPAEVLQPAPPSAGSNAVQPPQPDGASEVEADSFAYPQPSTATHDLPDSISWSASEFIAHEKTAGWYALLILAAVIAVGVIWLLTRDPFPTAAVSVGIVLLAIYAAHQPRQQQYRLDSSGLTIGNRHLPYHEFRSFSAVPEGAFLSIELTPLKRFAMYTTIYLDPKDEDKILAFLSAHLSMNAARPSLTDNLMRKIHF